VRGEKQKKDYKMKIKVNGKKIDYKPIFPLTWGNFLQKLLQEGNHIQKDHGIIGIKLDGVDSLQVMTEETDKMVSEDIKLVEIITRDSAAITKEGLEKVVILIESMKEEVASAADLYREGNLKDASSKIARVMEAFKPMVNFVQSVGISFSMNFDQIMFNQTTNLREKIEAFLQTLADLVSAQQKKDYKEVADHLEYQLIDDLSDWTTVANILRQEVEASQGKQ
jgi:dimeric dUTPase (all-alpha-NTP-PPase superfamily)